ncbi:MAG: hypothetical protein AAB932_06340, partial [Patescibacteria group bacterium]
DSKGLVCVTGKNRRITSCSFGGLIKDYINDLWFFSLVWLIFSITVPPLALPHALFIVVLSFFVYKRMKTVPPDSKVFAQFLGRMYLASTALYALVWPVFEGIIF